MEKLQSASEWIPGESFISKSSDVADSRFSRYSPSNLTSSTSIPYLLARSIPHYVHTIFNDPINQLYPVPAARLARPTSVLLPMSAASVWPLLSRRALRPNTVYVYHLTDETKGGKEENGRGRKLMNDWEILKPCLAIYRFAPSLLSRVTPSRFSVVPTRDARVLSPLLTDASGLSP